jgi:uroporphyrinogen-III synthase
LHRVEPHPDLGQPLPDHDIIYFTSPSGVRAWMDAYGPGGVAAPAWAMGDVTAGELTSHGIDSEVVTPYVS